MKKVRILIADDHELMRKGLRATLETHSGWEIVSEATNGRALVEQARALKPDIVVTDISMPELNGLEATRRICAAFPKARVLILTVHESEQVVREVLDADAKGYLLKSDAGRDLVTAIESLLKDRLCFTSKVARLVLGGFLSGAPAKIKEEIDSPLSPREREIVQLVAEGKSSKEIAAGRGISVKTAEAHRSNLMRKLGFHSVSEVVRYAIRNKIVEA